MKLNNIIKTAPLALLLIYIGIHSQQPSRKRAAESQEESNKRARIATVTLLTSDSHEIIVNKSLAEKSSFITGMLQSLGNSDEPIPLPDIDREEIVPIIAILTELDNANQAFIKPHGERYIPQRIQPIINQILQPIAYHEMPSLVLAANKLDLGYLTNGIIRTLVERLLTTDPEASVDEIIGLPLRWTLPEIRKLVEYHYQLVKNGNIPELSVADYSAINSMPEVEEIDEGDYDYITENEIGDFIPGYTRCLILDEHRLTNLNGLNEIPGIQTVHYLFIRNNNLITIPANAFRACTALRQLFLNENKLIGIDGRAFSNLPTITLISLERNQLTELPDTAFNGLTNLEWLTLSKNMITNLSANVFNGLTILTTLHLYENQLTTLPNTIFNGLTNLESLNVSENMISDLPATVFNGLTRLKELALTNNRITTLPNTIFNGLTNLESLTLYHNMITNLPDTAFNGLPNLEILDLSSNSIAQLPATLFNGLTDLNDLNLESNRITQLPPTLFNNLMMLFSLTLNNNQLDQLPATIFQGLTRLSFLDLNNNQLTELPAELFQDLRQLVRLAINNNQLSTLPVTIFRGLNRLSHIGLNQNLVTQNSLPATIFHGLAALKDLNILSQKNGILQFHAFIAGYFSDRQFQPGYPKTDMGEIILGNIYE